MEPERGTVKWFDEGKGYGFITPDSGHKDLFFHRSDLDNMEKTVDKGERVEFEIGDGPKGKQAKKVRPSPLEG